VQNSYLTDSDLEYIADILAAVIWAEQDLPLLKHQTKSELIQHLKLAEAALRRASAEAKPLNKLV